MPKRWSLRKGDMSRSENSNRILYLMGSFAQWDDDFGLLKNLTQFSWMLATAAFKAS